MEVVYDFKQDVPGIAIDSEDNIFVANYYNYSIDKISLNNGKFSITQSTNISPSLPQTLAINSKNEIYIGTLSRKIKKMTKEGIISNVAGVADGIRKNDKIGLVNGLCFDENDIVYFCDSSIRTVTPEGKVTTVCGRNGLFQCPRGIAYNPSSKIFYITDDNKSIRTMTVDGNVNTLCKYPDLLWAIAIDGEGKIYVSTRKDSSGGEGEIITFDSKGNVKKMNISVKSCYGIAFNSKGDLFFTSDKKLSVIRNCTKYPPHPILSPTTNINTKESQSDLQELKKKLATTQTENQKLENSLKESETQNKSLEMKLQEFKEKETKEQTGDEVLKWLTSIKLANLFSFLQDIGAKDLEFLKLLEENDFEGLNIKPSEKRMLFQAIKKLKEDSAIKVFQNNEC